MNQLIISEKNTIVIGSLTSSTFMHNSHSKRKMSMFLPLLAVDLLVNNYTGIQIFLSFDWQVIPKPTE